MPKGWLNGAGPKSGANGRSPRRLCHAYIAEAVEQPLRPVRIADVFRERRSEFRKNRRRRIVSIHRRGLPLIGSRERRDFEVGWWRLGPMECDRRDFPEHIALRCIKVFDWNSDIHEPAYVGVPEVRFILFRFLHPANDFRQKERGQRFDNIVPLLPRKNG